MVAAVECAIAIQKLMTERNAETPEGQAHPLPHRHQPRRRAGRGRRHCRRRRQYRSAARRHLRAGRRFISGTAYDHVRGRVDANFVDLGEKDLKNIARPVRVYAIRPGSESAAPAPSVFDPNTQGPPRLSLVVLPFANYVRRPGTGVFRRWRDREPDH